MNILITRFGWLLAFQCRRWINPGLFVLKCLLLVLTQPVRELLIGSELFKRTFADQAFKICLEQNFFFQQFFRNDIQMLAMLRQ